MKKIIISALSLFVLCMPLISLAHPGHGETGGYTIIHYFMEPMHVIISVIVLIIGSVVYNRHLRRNKQRSENI